MRPEQQVLDAIRTMGATATLLAEGGDITFLACIQPDLRLQKEEVSPLGVGRSSRATLYAPVTQADGHIREGSRLAWCGKIYRVLQWENFCLQGKPLYLWAVLEAEEEEE